MLCGQIGQWQNGVIEVIDVGDSALQTGSSQAIVAWSMSGSAGR